MTARAPRASETRLRRSKPRDRSDLRGTRVLVVEDDRLVIAGYKRLFEGLGCVVEVATTASDAMSHAPSSYDLALIDLKLRQGSEGSGLDVVHFLLAQPVGIVVVTGTGGFREGCALGRLGPDCFEKPVGSEELLDACSGQLAWARATRTARHGGTRVSRDRAERAMMIAALERHDWCVTHAANFVHMDRSQFRRRAHALAIALPSEASNTA